MTAGGKESSRADRARAGREVSKRRLSFASVWRNRSEFSEREASQRVQRWADGPIGGILPAFDRVLAFLVGVSGAIFPTRASGDALEDGVRFTGGNAMWRSSFSRMLRLRCDSRCCESCSSRHELCVSHAKCDRAHYFVDVSGVKGPTGESCADSNASLLPMQLKGNEDLQQRVQIQNTTREQQKPYIDVSRPFLNTEPH